MPQLAVATKYPREANRWSPCGLSGEVEGQNVVLVVDDLVDCGCCNHCKASLLKRKGHKSVGGVHPVLSGGAYETIENSVLTKLR